jgi:selenium metabolism protein YedF
MMGQIVDARGLACPQPVVNTRKALESSDMIITIVDNMTAVENLRRMASSLGCNISEDRKPDGYYLTITKSLVDPSVKEAAPMSAAHPSVSSGQPQRGVLLMSQDIMGRGDEQLGKILIRAFFHTIAENPPAPETIIFLNTGVRLVVEGSDVLEDIQSLEKSGTRILSCGTCLDYLNIKDRVRVGVISNMYEIKEILMGGSSVTTI